LEKIAPLNVGRSAHTSFSFENKYIYVYGGRNDSHPISDFEKIELDGVLNGKWIQLPPKASLERIPFYFINTVRMSEDEVMILGSKDKLGQDTKSWAVFNKNTEKLALAPSVLAELDECFMHLAIGPPDGSRTIAVVTHKGTLHLFNGSKWVFFK